MGVTVTFVAILELVRRIDRYRADRGARRCTCAVRRAGLRLAVDNDSQLMT